MTITAILLILGGFFLGAIPFSVLVGRLGLKKEIREYGDGNPGAFNVIRAGGLIWGGIAIFLDIGKGAVTVGLANYIFSIDGLPLVLIAIAPPFGHAFSPFLGFRGGKAIAAIGGVWIGLTLVIVPLIGMIALVFWFSVITISGWAVILTMFTALVYLILASLPIEFYVIWALHLALLVYKHRADLSQRPGLKMPSFKSKSFNNGV